MEYVVLSNGVVVSASQVSDVIGSYGDKPQTRADRIAQLDAEQKAADQKKVR